MTHQPDPTRSGTNCATLCCGKIRPQPASLNLPDVLIREASGAFLEVHRSIQQTRQALAVNTIRAVLRVTDALLVCATVRCGGPLKTHSIEVPA